MIGSVARAKALACSCRTSASRDRQPDPGGSTIAKKPKAAAHTRQQRPLLGKGTFFSEVAVRPIQPSSQIKILAARRAAREPGLPSFATVPIVPAYAIPTKGDLPFCHPRIIRQLRYFKVSNDQANAIHLPNHIPWQSESDPMSGVNYFFALTTIISPGQRQLLFSS